MEHRPKKLQALQSIRIVPGQSALCPACQATDETIEHLYSCPEPSVSAVLDAEFHSFKTKLSKGAPNEILDGILVGIHWHVFLDLTCCLPHLIEVNSNNPVAEAYHSQSEIGWDSQLCGHVSIK